MPRHRLPRDGPVPDLHHPKPYRRGTQRPVRRRDPCRLLRLPQRAFGRGKPADRHADAEGDRHRHAYTDRHPDRSNRDPYPDADGWTSDRDANQNTHPDGHADRRPSDGDPDFHPGHPADADTHADTDAD